MTIPTDSPESRSLPPPTKRARPIGRRAALAAALVGAFAIGAGATAIAQHGQRTVLVSMAPAPIADMKNWSPVAVKGQVAEIFGSRFVVSDDSGRALVDGGPQGDSGTLVAKAETVTVQGRFENGSIHALAIQHADGRTDMVGPAGPPPHGPLGWLGPDGGPHGWFARRS